VLPVGGIKEKILAAVARNISAVIIPKQNIKDIEEVPEYLLSRITVLPMETLEQVLKRAFIPSKAARGAFAVGKSGKTTSRRNITEQKARA
jgi:ATP-dependent Lon protease